MREDTEPAESPRACADASLRILYQLKSAVTQLHETWAAESWSVVVVLIRVSLAIGFVSRRTRHRWHELNPLNHAALNP